MLRDCMDPFPFAAVGELLDALTQARAEAEMGHVKRVVLRKLQALGSDLARAGRLARRSKPLKSYDAIAWPRVEAIAATALQITGLPQASHQRLRQAAGRILGTVDLVALSNSRKVAPAELKEARSELMLIAR